MLTRFRKKGPPLGGPANQAPSADVEPVASSAGKTWGPGDIIADRYQVEEVAAGAMGLVYIAKHLEWQIRMAIKSPRPEVMEDREGLRSILREANNWVRLGMHPNIASCYYVLSIENIPHIFIEYVDGGSLSDWIRAGRCRDLRTALSLAIQFCHGMEYTHAHGIIHRDIKPANILLTRNALLKITDFGILLSLDESRRNNGQDSEETPSDQLREGFKGTPGYASPEQFVDAGRVDQRSDIFSFGICLWLMLCGRKPYRLNYEQQPVPEPIPQDSSVSFPPSLVDLLKKCVAFSKDQRFSDFAAFRHALHEAYQDLFQFPCPYFELANLDLRADSLNNHGVSLIELRRLDDAAKCFNQALDRNDVLPEALYNRLLLQWLTGKNRLDRLLRSIDATCQSSRTPRLFSELKEFVKDHHETPVKERGSVSPGFKLCSARNTIDIYREGQLFDSVRRSIRDHVNNDNYAACQEELLRAWQNIGFRKDQLFTKIYEKLLKKGTAKKFAGCQRIFTMPPQKGGVKKLHYLAAHKKIAALSSTGQIYIHGLGRAKPPICLTSCTEVTTMAVSADNGLLATANRSGDIAILPLGPGEKMTIRTGCEVPALTFHPTQPLCVAGLSNGAILLMHLDSKKKEKFGEEKSGGVRSLLFLERFSLLVAGYDDGSLHYWDLVGKECIRIVEAHALPVDSLQSSKDGLRLGSASADRFLRLWDPSSGKSVMEKKAHEEAITALLLNDDHQYAVSGCEDDTVKIWKNETGAAVATLNGRGDGILSLAWGPQEHIFLAGRKDGGITGWMIIYRFEFS